MGFPSGLCTETCMCHSLLHLMDTDLANRQKFKGTCLLIPHGMQYMTLHPIIAEPCNHHGSLVDLNTGEPYPMKVVGNFCLKEAFFPSCLGDSLMFCHDELTKLRSRDSHPHPPGKSSRVYQQLKGSPVSPLQGELTEASSQRQGVQQAWQQDLRNLFTSGPRLHKHQQDLA